MSSIILSFLLVLANLAVAVSLAPISSRWEFFLAIGVPTGSAVVLLYLWRSSLRRLHLYLCLLMLASVISWHSYVYGRQPKRMKRQILLQDIPTSEREK